MGFTTRTPTTITVHDLIDPVNGAGQIHCNLVWYHWFTQRPYTFTTENGAVKSHADITKCAWVIAFMKLFASEGTILNPAPNKDVGSQEYNAWSTNINNIGKICETRLIDFIHHYENNKELPVGKPRIQCKAIAYWRGVQDRLRHYPACVFNGLNFESVQDNISCESLERRGKLFNFCYKLHLSDSDKPYTML